MNFNPFLLFAIIMASTLLHGQVKVGDNINTIDAGSILELESSKKALVITRLSDVEMNALVPLNGALVYNTDLKCIFVFEGAVWKSLCNSEISVTTATLAPTAPEVGDIWLNETDNKTNVWDGTAWLPITKNPKTGSGIPIPGTFPDALAGDIYIDQTSGNIYTFNGTSWIGQTKSAANGISETQNNVFELGGALTKPTEISTDNTNTLAINGLEETADNNNLFVTVNPNTGVLQKTSASAFLEQEEILIIANEAQTQFNPPLAISSSKKLNVYRNGVKLGFTIIDNSTIELEAPVFCYQNDEIRIVQFY